MRTTPAFSGKVGDGDSSVQGDLARPEIQQKDEEFDVGRNTRPFEKPLCFLDLSAELRNRIYDVAITPELPYLPESTDFITEPFYKPYLRHYWDSFGLTQICHQIRAEFRPLWLQNAIIGVSSLEASESFTSIFMPTEAEFKNAPALLLIAWEHGVENKMGQHDITHLLRLRAYCSTFRFSFVPGQCCRRRDPFGDICAYCAKGEEKQSETTIVTECTCPPSSLDIEYRGDFYMRQLDYLRPISKLLLAENEAWLADLRDGKISIRVSIDRETNRAVIHVRYHDQLLGDINNDSLIQELDARWCLSEMLDVPHHGVSQISRMSTEDGLVSDIKITMASQER